MPPCCACSIAAGISWARRSRPSRRSLPPSPPLLTASAWRTAPMRWRSRLRGLGIGPGDGVLSVSHTAVATVAAIELVGATAVLGDIEPAYYTLDPKSLDAALAGEITGGQGAKPKIKAVIVVHLYGQPADMTAIAASRQASWRRRHRGLRPGPWRDAERQACRRVRRCRRLQSLPDEESRRVRRRRHRHHQ